jgi:YfiH family protein
LPYGIEVAYSTAADGDQREPGLRTAFAHSLWAADSEPPRRLVVPRQVHGIEVITVGSEAVPPPLLAQADGAVSGEPGVAVGAYGADCPGVVLATPDAVGIAHCGWRGTAGGMVDRLVTALADCSATPRSAWRALIGPGISGAQYEVDAPVLTARVWPPAALTPAAQPGRAHLDLAVALEADLQAAGITAVIRTGVCTATDPRLHSFRRRGPGLVQMLVAWRR